MRTGHFSRIAGTVAAALLTLVFAGDARAGGSATGAAYVALGDSYAAGEGLGGAGGLGFESGTSEFPILLNGSNIRASKNTCHRSETEAYASLGRSPKIVLPSISDRSFWACSGATTDDMTTDVGGLPIANDRYQSGQPSQISTIGGNTRYVSISAGGNDIEFGKLGTSCARILVESAYSVLGFSIAKQQNLIRVPSQSSCDSQITVSKSRLGDLQDRDGRRGKLSVLFKRILDAPSKPTLVVAGYPRIFPASYDLSWPVNNGRDQFCLTNTVNLPVPRLPGATVRFGAGVMVDDAKKLDKGIFEPLNKTLQKVAEKLSSEGGYGARIKYADSYSASLPTSCRGEYVSSQTLNGVMLSVGTSDSPVDLDAFIPVMSLDEIRHPSRIMDRFKSYISNGTKRFVSTATFHPTQPGQELMGRSINNAFRSAVGGDKDDGVLPGNDDGSSNSVGLPFAISFSGNEYSSIWVNNNGNVTFDGPTSQYTPSPITGLVKRIIAPFWADVDTRCGVSGQTTYGVTKFEGRTAFRVTWPMVGYYSCQTDKLNSFSLLLVGRSDVRRGDFDVVFNYSRIKWETGSASGGSGGFGGSSAGAGLSNATDSWYEIPGSRVPGSLVDGGPLSLTGRSNVARMAPGTWLWKVRGGRIAG